MGFPLLFLVDLKKLSGEYLAPAWSLVAASGDMFAWSRGA